MVKFGLVCLGLSGIHFHGNPMARRPKNAGYPREIKVGSVVIKIYRLAHPKTKNGFVYQVTYRDASGVRRKPQFTDPNDAEAEARLQGSKLAAGRVEAAEMTRADRDELLAIRKLCGTTPPLSAVNEWFEAKKYAGDNLLPAAKAWAQVNGRTFTPILADKCVDEFITAKNAAGKQGDRVYRSKLAPIRTRFAGRELHTITAVEWESYLAQFPNGVTRNDLRKRAVTMCRWAQKYRYLPRGVPLEVAETERAEEERPEVGIATPEAFGRLLQHLRQNHPHHLATLVLAGFCGIRSDELHGKRDDRSKRQLWSDVHVKPERHGNRRTEPFASVTNAKKNTPAWREVPLCKTAVAWLELCPAPHEGPVGEPAAMDRIRDIGRSAGLDLPENCFRHSYISYSIALHGDKALVATRAGTSVAKIDQHYRRPVPQSVARAWFGMGPGEAAKLPALDVHPLMGSEHLKLSRKGGMQRSPKKVFAVTQNLPRRVSIAREPSPELSLGKTDHTRIEADVRDATGVDRFPK